MAEIEDDDYELEDDEERKPVDILSCPVCGNKFEMDPKELRVIRGDEPEMNEEEEDYYWIRHDHSPHFLPCEHTICRKCVKSRLVEEDESFKITCPLCDEKHSVKDNAAVDPSSIYPVDQGVRHVLRQVKILELSKAAHQISIVMCEECEEKPANTWCEICDDTFCEDCARSTHSTRRLRTHPLVSLAEKKPSLPRCRLHEQKPMDMFCLDHNVLICDFCERYGRHHNHLVGLHTEAERTVRPRLRQQLSFMRERLNLLNRSIEEVQDMNDDIDMECDRVTKDINATFNVLSRILAKQREMLLSHVALEKRKQGFAVQNQKRKLMLRAMFFRSLVDKVDECLNDPEVTKWQMLRVEEEFMSEDVRILLNHRPVCGGVSPLKNLDAFRNKFSDLMHNTLKETLDFAPINSNVVLENEDPPTPASVGEYTKSVSAPRILPKRTDDEEELFPKKIVNAVEKDRGSDAVPIPISGAIGEGPVSSSLSVKSNYAPSPSTAPVIARPASPGGPSPYSSSNVDAGASYTGGSSFARMDGRLQMRPMLWARSGLSVVSLKGDVYAVGGWDGTSRLNSVEKFDFKLQKWKLAAPLVRARSGLSVSVMNNLLYSVGGWDGNHRLGTIEAYLPSENTWSEVTSMRIPRSGHATAVLKPYIYVIGGTSTSKPLRAVEFVNLTNLRWVEAASLNHPREGLGCAVIADTIFVVGGFDGSQFLPYVEKYDQLRNVWVECEGMNQGRSGLSVVSYRGSLFALGGYAGKGALRTVERYDLTTNRWYSVGNLNVPRSGLSAAIVQDRIVIFGGFDGTKALNSIEIYDPVDDEWTLVQ
eukprot:CAMPEP_0201490588 /NCGR_PEP_ID=MMETSP0151_2-20130828/26647_1 /ASSEMBLY_ACC=CAM_ASM_000257 /TAXON_ID=200890 /ORGANISM="Paramoeba atlantica, Strain 621/1 / CCAP 1560/9" /LENGTH=818 /DNA_ID=CAMNT_0047876589 /DNA_START=98 /DNA_END=2554 /DNA_ORIENTATION=+